MNNTPWFHCGSRRHAKTSCRQSRGRSNRCILFKHPASKLIGASDIYLSSADVEKFIRDVEKFIYLFISRHAPRQTSWLAGAYIRITRTLFIGQLECQNAINFNKYKKWNTEVGINLTYVILERFYENSEQYTKFRSEEVEHWCQSATKEAGRFRSFHCSSE